MTLFARLRGSGLARAAVASLVIKVANAGLLLLSTVVLARWLGAEQYGVYAFAIAVTGLLAIPTQFGLPNLLARNIAAYQARDEAALLAEQLRWADRFVLRMSLVVIGLAGVAALWVGFDRDNATHASLALALVAMPILVVARIRGAALRGFRKVLVGQVPEFILQPGTLMVLVAVFLLAGSHAPSAVLAMGAYLASCLVACVFGVVALRTVHPGSAASAAPADCHDRADWRRSLLPLGLLAGSHFVIQYTDAVMLGLLAGQHEVGVYRVAAQVAVVVAIGLRAVNMSVGPHIARAFALGDLNRVERIARLSARGVLAVALPIAVAFWIWGEALLAMVFGAQFAGGHVALVILVAGQVVNAATGSVAMVLTMGGLEAISARVFAWSAGLNVVLNLLLIPGFGIHGAALATAVSVAFWNILLLVAVRRRLGISTTAL